MIKLYLFLNITIYCIIIYPFQVVNNFPHTKTIYYCNIWHKTLQNLNVFTLYQIKIEFHNHLIYDVKCNNISEMKKNNYWLKLILFLSLFFNTREKTIINWVHKLLFSIRPQNYLMYRLCVRGVELNFKNGGF